MNLLMFQKMLDDCNQHRNETPNQTSLRIVYLVDEGIKYTDVVITDASLMTTFTFYSDTGLLYDVQLVDEENYLKLERTPVNGKIFIPLSNDDIDHLLYHQAREEVKRCNAEIERLKALLPKGAK